MPYGMKPCQRCGIVRRVVVRKPIEGSTDRTERWTRWCKACEYAHSAETHEHWMNLKLHQAQKERKRQRALGLKFEEKK